MVESMVATQERFHECESGAVTVDWVVLTAGVMLAFVLAGQPIYGVMGGLVDQTASEIDNIDMDPNN